MGAEPWIALFSWVGWSGAAHAWAPNGSSWAWQRQALEDPILLSADTFPPEEVGQDALQQAVDAAMQTWNEAGYALSLRQELALRAPTQDADGQFNLFHGEADDMGSALAYTAIWSYADGMAFDCDILFLDADDDGDIVWSALAGETPEGSWDVQSVALHELGHCIGLAHSEDAEAIMYAHYTGSRELGEDDLTGLGALFEPACADEDGDGSTACDGDCDDQDGLVSPRAEELCNGVDDNCNGAIDEIEGLTVTLGSDSEDADWSEQSVGNGFRIVADTTLRGLSQRWEGPAGARLVWSVSRLEVDGSWSLVASARGEAEAGEWQHSPSLDLPLEADQTYAVVLGAFETGVTMYYQKRPNLDAVGPLAPLGSLYGRAIGDSLGEPDDRYLVYQELTLTEPEDEDAICTDALPETGEPLDSGADEDSGAGEDGGLEKATGCGCSSPPDQPAAWLWIGALTLLWRRRSARLQA